MIACFCVVLSIMLHIEPVNMIENRLGDWGIKIGLLDEKRFESSWVFELPDEASLKRTARRLSERPYNCPELKWDRSLRREPSER